MAQRNSHKKNNSDDHFDLDDYINEKSTVEEETPQYDDSVDKKSSLMKNTILIIGLVIFTILYFNDWSIKQVFGFNDYQEVTTTSQFTPSGDILVTGTVDETTLAGLAKLKELEKLRGLENLEALEGLSNLENLEGLKILEQNLAEFDNSQEVNELRRYALETAKEALKSINLPQNTGNDAQLEIQEALRELDALQEQNLAEQSEITTTLSSSFNEYSNNLSEIGITEFFDSSDLKKLHDANIPASYLKQLNDLNLLEKLNANSIIEAFTSKN